VAFEIIKAYQALKDAAKKRSADNELTAQPPGGQTP